MITVVLGAGFVVLLLVGLIVELTARRPAANGSRLGELLSLVVATRTGRIIAVLVWGWLGWHFLAR